MQRELPAKGSVWNNSEAIIAGVCYLSRAGVDLMLAQPRLRLLLLRLVDVTGELLRELLLPLDLEHLDKLRVQLVGPLPLVGAPNPWNLTLYTVWPR